MRTVYTIGLKHLAELEGISAQKMADDLDRYTLTGELISVRLGDEILGVTGVKATELLASLREDIGKTP